MLFVPILFCCHSCWFGIFVDKIVVVVIIVYDVVVDDAVVVVNNYINTDVVIV